MARAIISAEARALKALVRLGDASLGDLAREARVPSGEIEGLVENLPVDVHLSSAETGKRAILRSGEAEVERILRESPRVLPGDGNAFTRRRAVSDDTADGSAPTSADWTDPGLLSEPSEAERASDQGGSERSASDGESGRDEAPGHPQSSAPGRAAPDPEPCWAPAGVALSAPLGEIDVLILSGLAESGGMDLARLGHRLRLDINLTARSVETLASKGVDVRIEDDQCPARVRSGHSPGELHEIAVRGPVPAASGGQAGVIVSGVERDVLRIVAESGGCMAVSALESELGTDVEPVVAGLRLKGEDIRLVEGSMRTDVAFRRVRNSAAPECASEERDGSALGVIAHVAAAFLVLCVPLGVIGFLSGW